MRLSPFLSAFASGWMTMIADRPPPPLPALEPDTAPPWVDLSPGFVEILQNARAEIARAKRILAMIEGLDEKFAPAKARIRGETPTS
jgi:hypothetical protein